MKITKNSPILNSAIKAWNGEEKPWKVFWLWGVFFYTSSFCVILFKSRFFAFLEMHEEIEKLNILITIFSFFYSIFIFLCAFTLAFIYPIIFLIALNRCCHNKLLKVVIRLLSYFAISVHFLFAMLCGFGSEMFFSFGLTYSSAYLVVTKITDYIYNKTTENIVYSKIYILLTGLIYLINLYYLINVVTKFFNQNTKLDSRKLSFMKVFNLSFYIIIIMVCFFLITWEED
jgi:hypothetical protein